MKFQLVFFGSLIALVACMPAEDAGLAKVLLRSCDRNADNALYAAEFAGCLMQQSRQQRMAASKMGISRTELLQSFMDNADLNNDLRADEAELQEWSARWLLSGLFGGGDGDSLTISEIIDQIVLIFQYIGEERYASAIIELYALIAGDELSSSSQVSIRLAITAIEDENYGQAIGFIYSVIRELAGGDEAGGIFVVSASTVTNVASLLEAVIEGDSANINFYIYRSLASVIVDFSFLTEASASSVAALIQAVIENNSDEFYISLTAVIDTIEGISSKTAAALSELLEVVVYGPSSEVSVKIFAVLSAVLEDDDAAEIAQIFVAVIQAVIDGDDDEAIEQLTLLYVRITEGGSGGSGGTGSSSGSSTVVVIAAIIKALQDGNYAIAVNQIDSLIRSSSSGLSSSQISSLEIIIQVIEDDRDYDEAISLLIAVASGGSSSSSSSVEISVDVFLAISSVITILEDSEDADEAILIIYEILNDSSITISVEVRAALQALIYVLSEETIEEALVLAVAISSGSSDAFEVEISSRVTIALNLVIAALDDDDADGAIEIIEALLRGERGGSSLSIIVKIYLRQILIALEEGNVAQAYAQIVIVSVGERSSSLSVSATTSFLVALELLSSGSESDALDLLEVLLDDDSIGSSVRSTIEVIIGYIEAGRYSRARTEIIVSLVGTGYSFSSSISRSFFSALQLVIGGDFEGALEIIEEFYEDLDVSIRLVVIFLIRLLRARNLQGALAIINIIIAEAD